MAKEPRSCECGCGEQTKGGRFRPGHDSRVHGKKHQDRARAEKIAAPLSTSKIEWPAGRTRDGISAGMLVEGLMPLGKTDRGVVYRISSFGWVAYVNDNGKQRIGEAGQTTILEPDVRKIEMTPIQRGAIARLTN